MGRRFESYPGSQPVSDAAGKRAARIFAASAALIVVLAVAGFAALRFALHDLERRVVAALGPGSRVEAVRLDLASVEVEGVVIPGGNGWPAPESLRARRVRVSPTWRSLLSEHIEVGRVDVVDLSLSALRTRDGRVRVLPTLLETKPADAAAPAAGSTPPEAARLVA